MKSPSLGGPRGTVRCPVSRWLRILGTHKLAHRMNNELAAAIAVVSLAAARSPSSEVKSALRVVEARLHSYMLDWCLQRPSQDTIIDASAYLRGLCQSMSRSSLDCRGIQLQFFA